MADCYIVRRGGAGGSEKNDNDVMITLGQPILIPPIDEVFINKGEMEE